MTHTTMSRIGFYIYETETPTNLYSNSHIPNDFHCYNISINTMTRKQILTRIEQLKQSLKKRYLESYERHRIEQHIFHLQQELARLNKQQ